MRRLVVGMLVVGLAVCCGSTFADTLTWSGGSSGAFSSAANWTSAATGGQVAPQGGDICVFNKVVELSSETFDFGAAGLTLEVNANVNSHVAFSGTGILTKRGSSTLTTSAILTLTGGMLIEDGGVYAYPGSAKAFGDSSCGEIVLRKGTGVEHAPWLGALSYGCRIFNPIRIVNGDVADADSYPSFFGNNYVPDTMGAFTIEDDCVVRAGSSTMTIPSISGAGHTVTLVNHPSGGTLVVKGALEAGVKVKKASNATAEGVVELRGASTGADNSLEVVSGTCRLTATAAWAGTDVTVRGLGAARLQLNAAANLTVQTRLTVEQGGVVEVASGVCCKVAKFTVGTQDLDADTYDAEKLPGVIDGAGSIQVVGTDSFLLWNGGSSGTFSAAENWIDSQTGTTSERGPQGGDVCVFSAPVTLTAESFDFGDKGLTLETVANVSCAVSFTGTGVLTKRGAGELTMSVQSVLKGGFVIEEGGVRATKTGAGGNFGDASCGEIVLQKGKGVEHAPWLAASSYGCRIFNPIRVSDGDVADPSTRPSFAGFDYVADTTGAFTVEDDCTISAQNMTMQIPSVSGVGHTVTLEDRAMNGGKLAIKGSLEANVIVKAYNVKSPAGAIVEFQGVSTGVDNMLEIRSGTNVLTAAARWAGTNIVVRGTDRARLKLNHTANLALGAHLTVEDGGVLDLGATARPMVSRFTVAGVDMPAGVYAAENCPGVIEGLGRLVVAGVTDVQRVHVWNGGCSGKSWYEPANWGDGVVPQPGDTVVVTNWDREVSIYWEPVKIGLAAGEAVDFGDKGLTIVSAAKSLNTYVAFSGSGVLTLIGSGDITPCVTSTYAGGTVVRCKNLNYTSTSDAASYLGTGTVTLDRTSDSTPTLHGSAYLTTLTNDVAIQGAVTNGNGAICIDNSTYLNNVISGDDDFLIRLNSGALNLGNGSLSVPAGKTITIVNNVSGGAASAYKVNLNKPVSGNLTRDVPSADVADPTACQTALEFMANATCETNTVLTLNWGLNIFDSGCRWVGETLNVVGTGTLVKFSNRQNVSTNAVISVSNGGKMEIADGVRLRARALTIDGIAQDAGTYSAANCPAITGGGSLKVGETGLAIIVR